MMLGDHIVGTLNVSDQDVPVFNVNSEFMLEGLVHMDRGFDVRIASFVAPVGSERNGNALNFIIATFQRSGSTLLSL